MWDGPQSNQKNPKNVSALFFRNLFHLLTQPSVSDCGQPLGATRSSSELQNQLPFCELNLVTSLSHLCSYLRAFAPALPSAWSTAPGLCVAGPPCDSGLSLSKQPPAHCPQVCFLPGIYYSLTSVSSFGYGLNFRIPDSKVMSSVPDKHLVSLGQDCVPALTVVNAQGYLLQEKVNSI